MLPLRLLRNSIPYHQTRHYSSVSSHELSHFAKLAGSWWDPMGPSRVLHLMNPLRHDFIATCLADDTHPTDKAPAIGLDYLDIGCGGGIFAESIARMIPRSTAADGRTPNSVTALDPSDKLIAIARAHARLDPVISSLLLDGRFRYLNRSVEEHVSSQSLPPSALRRESDSAVAETRPGLRNVSTAYDVITLFEVLEHIDPASSSPRSFLSTCLSLLKPGGWLIGSTIARSVPSFIVNQVIAEAPWPIGVVPRGTHQWNKFVNPDEVKEWTLRILADGRALENQSASGSKGVDLWKCAGAMYFPGLGWKMVDGSERWGNYFWGVRKGL